VEYARGAGGYVYEEGRSCPYLVLFRGPAVKQQQRWRSMTFCRQPCVVLRQELRCYRPVGTKDVSEDDDHLGRRKDWGGATLGSPWAPATGRSREHLLPWKPSQVGTLISHPAAAAVVWSISRIQFSPWRPAVSFRRLIGTHRRTHDARVEFWVV
jgi:hypothetical protein